MVTLLIQPEDGIAAQRSAISKAKSTIDIVIFVQEIMNEAGDS